MNQSHWYDPYRAAEVLGDLFDVVINVSKTSKPAPPKPSASPDRPKPDKGRPALKG